MKAFRIALERHARSADDLLSSEGARQFGGRWNYPGIPAVYCSESLSLAALEILVHISRPEALNRYRYLEIEIPDSAVTQVNGISPEDMESVDHQEPFRWLLSTGG